MDYKTMSFAELEERKAQIGIECEAEGADTAALLEEVRAINAEIEERKQAEARQAELRAAVATGAGTVTEEDHKETRTMDNREIRNSAEYIDAYAKYIRTGNAAECRALLSDAASGTVPVPEFAAEIVAARVKESRILSRISTVRHAGVLKTGFEISAPAAEYHAEGGEEIDEENLVLGIVTQNLGSWKKWVSFSDELLDNSRAFVEYIYNEITRGIIKAQEKDVITAILAAPQTATATAPAVAKTGSAASAITDIVDAEALLSSDVDVDNLVVIVSPSDYAMYKGLQLSGTYGADPFDGIEVIKSAYATAPIVGDLAGVTRNLPKGDELEFKLDDKTLMTSDLVRLLGKLPGSVAVTANLFFAKVSA